MAHSAALFQVLFACSFLACSSDRDEQATQATSDEIIGGKSASATDYAASTGLVLPWLGNATCSGVVVGPRHILTAAHCLWNASSFQLSSGSASWTAFRPSNNGTASSVSFTVKQLHVLPRWTQVCSVSNCYDEEGMHLGAPDVGIIETQSALNLPEARIDPKAVAPGDKVTLVGVGCETKGQSYSSFASRKVKFLDTSVVAASGVEAGAFFQGAMNSTARGCPGDSGGGVYRTGTDIVVGVHIASELNGSVVGTWTRLDTSSKDGVTTWLAGLGVNTVATSEPAPVVEPVPEAGTPVVEPVPEAGTPILEAGSDARSEPKPEASPDADTTVDPVASGCSAARTSRSSVFGWLITLVLVALRIMRWRQRLPAAPSQQA